MLEPFICVLMGFLTGFIVGGILGFMMIVLSAFWPL